MAHDERDRARENEFAMIGPGSVPICTVWIRGERFQWIAADMLHLLKPGR